MGQAPIHDQNGLANVILKQECIPVACVPSASVAPVHAGILPPSPVNRMTDACENITLPQLRCGRLLSTFPFEINCFIRLFIASQRTFVSATLKKA